MPNFGSGFVPSDQSTSDWLRAVRSYAQGSNRQAVNVLESEFDDNTESLVLRFPVQGVQPGQTIEIGWVEYSVVDASPSTKTLIVIRADEDSPHTVHPAGERVVFRPRFTTRRIITELNAELDQLSAEGLYRVVTVAASTDGGVDLPDGALALLDAWSNEERQRKLPTSFYQFTESATGPVLVGPSTLVRVVLGCTLNHLPHWSEVQVAEHTGLIPTALDIPPLGASIRLLMGTESQRNVIDHQGETRRAGEVPTGGPTTALRNLAAMRQTRLNQEVARIQQRYGYVMHVGVY